MQTKVMVRNLAYDTTEADLEEFFAPHGTVLKAQISRYPDGQPRGFAFIEMSTQVSAEAAIRFLNLRELKGRRVDVMLAVERTGKSSSGRRRHR